MKREQEGLEKLRLLGQLAGDDVAAVSDSRASNIPDWREYVNSQLIRAPDAELLISITDSNDLLMRLRTDSHLMDVIVTILSTTNADAQVVLYLSDRLIDACRSDAILWDMLARSETPKGLTPHMACFRALERNWQDTVVNDNLLFLLCGLQSHFPLVSESRKICKLALDHKIVRMTGQGRLRALASLLKWDGIRTELFNSSACRALIAQGMLSNDLGSMYHAVVAFWLMTFDERIIFEGGPLSQHRSILEAFTDMFARCKKEKIVRVACYILRNLLDTDWIFEILFLKKFDHIFTLLEYEKWRDTDLYEDIQEISRVFYTKTLQYSNFSRYNKELDSGVFRAGPLHTEKFWRENLSNFEDNEFVAIKKLSALLASTDNTTLALALFDIGEFCRLHPTGRRLIQRYGAKDMVIKLMSHTNKEVAREALLCTQKIMLEDWRRLDSSSA